jgi:hypothetical protein
MGIARVVSRAQVVVGIVAAIDEWDDVIGRS